MKKRYLLLLSLLLYIPLLHELGHVFICKLFNVKVYGMTYTFTVYEPSTNVLFNNVQELWEYITIFVPFICIVIICYLAIRDAMKNNIS